MRSSIRLLGAGLLTLGCSAAWSQTNIPGHVLDANNQLNNYGQRIYVNNPTPKINYGSGTTRSGVYQGTNRWSSSYSSYPMHGNVYVNGMGPFPSSNLFPSRYSYELQAPLFTPTTTGDLMNHRDSTSAPVYVKNPVPGVPGYGTANPAPSVSPNSIAPRAIDNRIDTPNLADSARISNSISAPGTISTVTTTVSTPVYGGDDHTLSCGSASSSEIAADISGYALKSLAGTLVGANTLHLRSNQVIGYIDFDKTEEHTYRVYKLDSTEIWIPLGVSTNTPFKAHVKGVGAQDLNCVIK